MLTKTWAHYPAGVYGALAAGLLLLLMLFTGQQLLWLPLCALGASLLASWYWPHWVLKNLQIQSRCLSALRQGEPCQWHISLSSSLPLWGLKIHGPIGLKYNSFIVGTSAELALSTTPLLAGCHSGEWHCEVHYPFNLWQVQRTINTADIEVLPALEVIEYLPLPEGEPGQLRRALLCFDSRKEFALGEDVNQSQIAQLKVMANLSRALAAKGFEVTLATSLGLRKAYPYSRGFNCLDEFLLQSLAQPASALDLLARYNLRPDAHLLVVPQWLSTAKAPEVFSGQILWQLLFDEERFEHPLSRSRHFHRKRAATHWQWVIEPAQPLGRLFHVG